MRTVTLFLLTAASTALALAACSDNGGDNGAGAYGGSAGAATGGAAGSTTDAGDSAAGSAGSPADGGAGSAGSETDGGAGNAGSSPGDAAAASATWTQVYTTVIATRCTPCHTTPGGGGVTNGKLDMTSQAAAYSNLVNVPAAGNACSGQATRVVPGSADTSLLYKKIDPGQPAPCGAKMPLGGAELSEQEADTIASWINAGALDN